MGDILCRYERRSGDLFVRSCARVLRMECVSVVSDGCISGAMSFMILFGVSVLVYVVVMCV